MPRVVYDLTLRPDAEAPWEFRILYLTDTSLTGSFAYLENDVWVPNTVKGILVPPVTVVKSFQEARVLLDRIQQTILGEEVLIVGYGPSRTRPGCIWIGFLRVLTYAHLAFLYEFRCTYEAPSWTFPRPTAWDLLLRT